MVRNSIISGVILVLLGTILGTSLLKSSDAAPHEDWNESSSLAEVLETLGYELKNKKPAKLDDEMVRMGRELITIGKTVGPDGNKTKRQSRYYVCTNCHNTQQEDPSLAQSDPDARLDYILKKGIPLLQGTTFYGQVNRESWYNDDYDKKYGALVKPARDSLEGALHLCATVCSQGRDFAPWEMEAVKQYFWTLEYKLGDLNLSKADYAKLNASHGAKSPEMVDWLKSKYLDYSPANFVEGPSSHAAGYEGIEGDPAQGKLIYDMACLACHNPSGPSEYLKLDHSDLSLAHLRRNIDTYGRFSIYQVIRHGTHPFAGHKPYMPHYTAQRMSDKQIEDIRAYLEQEG